MVATLEKIRRTVEECDKAIKALEQIKSWVYEDFLQSSNDDDDMSEDDIFYHEMMYEQWEEESNQFHYEQDCDNKYGCPMCVHK